MSKYFFLIFFSFILITEESKGKISIFHLDDDNYPLVEPKLSIQADSCEELKAEYEALIKWSQSRNDHSDQQKIDIDCLNRPTKRITISLSKLVNPHLLKIYNIKPKKKGPNCFNTAMIDAGFEKKEHFTSENEFASYLKYCRSRLPGEAPQPGDIGRIRGLLPMYKRPFYGFNKYEDLHGFTYINQLACSKNGMFPNSACMLQPLDDMYKIYGFEQKKECINPPENPPKECLMIVNFYNCQDQSHYGYSSLIKDYVINPYTLMFSLTMIYLYSDNILKFLNYK